MKPTWTQITLSVPTHDQDLLIGPLTALGFTSFLQEEGLLSGFIERRQWNRRREAALRTLLVRFRKQLPRLGTKIRQNTVREKNWNAAWERTVGIVEATDRIIIKPSWKRLRTKDRTKIVLHIDPKMSFGTGHHETTRLCLALLERHLRAGNSVLDVGTGTGILAIAARKLGARRVLAIDTDDWSVSNAQENVIKNGVAPQVTVRKSALNTIHAQRFDLVLANIDFPTISRSLTKLTSFLSRNGILILSGLLVSDLEQLLDLLKRQSAIPIELIAENEWAALALVAYDAGVRRKDPS